MGSSVYSSTVDARDPKKLATFWEKALESKRTYESDEDGYGAYA